MNYLVTGATGFVGRHLVPELLSRGHSVCVVEHQSPIPPALRSRVQVLSSARLDDVHRLAPSVAIHLATCFVGQHRPDQVSQMIEGNIAFGHRLLEALARPGCLGFVNVGSTWQHFESTAFHPFNLYAAHKQAFEDVLRYYCEVRGLRASTLKLGDSYGPGDPRRKVVTVLLEQLGKPVPLDMSGGEQCVDLLHVRDVVAAVLRAADLVLEQEVSASPREHFATSGQPMPLRALADLVREVGKKPLLVNWGALPYRPRENRNPVDFGERRLPGWRPRVDLRAGLEEMVAALGTP